MKKLVFDLDGTLVNPMPRDYLVYRDVMMRLNQKALEPGEFWSARRTPISIVELLKRTARCAVDDIVQQYLTMRHELIEQPEYLQHDALFPHVHDVLTTCAFHYECHLVTSRSSVRSTYATLDRLDLTKHMTSVWVTGGDKLSTIAEMEDVFAVIGDTEHDIVPAQQLGIKSIALSTGIRDRVFLEMLHPDHVFSNITEIMRVI